jgi:hypothetical protein
VRKNLSPTMRRAIEVARSNGGKLIRLVDEFWCGERLVPLLVRCEWFTTRTIEALVRRRLADYTNWTDPKFNDQGVLLEASFKPTEISLTSKVAEIMN